jgi:hypothetical protein
MGNNEDGNDSAFRRTQRMQIMSGLTPAYTPGEFVFLSSSMPGFPDGTRFKVVAARGVGSGQFRYELQANGQTIWVLEADLRTTPPEYIGERADRDAGETAFSMTQRMQTMTLTQRMNALGIDTEEADQNTTQRLKVLDGKALPKRAPDIAGPVTGTYPSEPPGKDGKPGPKKP